MTVPGGDDFERSWVLGARGTGADTGPADTATGSTGTASVGTGTAPASPASPADTGSFGGIGTVPGQSSSGTAETGSGWGPSQNAAPQPITPVPVRGRHEKPRLVERLRTRDGIILLTGAAVFVIGVAIAVAGLVARQDVPNRAQALARRDAAEARLATDRQRLDASQEPGTRLDTLITAFVTQSREYQANAVAETQKNQQLIDAFLRGDVAAYNTLVGERNAIVQQLDTKGATLLATLAELQATAGEIPRPAK